MQRREILRSSCAFGRVGSPPGRTKLVWATTQGGSSEGSRICYLTFVLLTQLYRHGGGWTEHYVSSELPPVGGTLGGLIGWYFAGLFVLQKWTQFQYVSKCMTKDGGIFACSLLHTPAFGVLPPEIHHHICHKVSEPASSHCFYFQEKRSQPLSF